MTIGYFQVMPWGIIQKRYGDRIFPGNVPGYYTENSGIIQCDACKYTIFMNFTLKEKHKNLDVFCIIIKAHVI